MVKYTTERIAEFLKAANKNLGSNKYSGNDMIPDYCKAVIMCKQLLVENKELKAQLIKNIKNREIKI